MIFNIFSILFYKIHFKKSIPLFTIFFLRLLDYRFPWLYLCFHTLVFVFESYKTGWNYCIIVHQGCYVDPMVKNNESGPVIVLPCQKKERRWLVDAIVVKDNYCGSVNVCTTISEKKEKVNKITRRLYYIR